jgi:predicted permease
VTSSLDLDQLQLDRSAGTRLYQAVVERFSALPGVVSVGLTSDLPLRTGRSVTVIADAESPVQPAAGQVTAAATVVSSRYFETLGLAIRDGRGFADNEPSRPQVAVINDAMARRLWPNRSPLGRTFKTNRPDAEPLEVIGVVANVAEPTSGAHAQPAFYRPFPGEYTPRLTVVMRVNTDPTVFFAAVRRTIQDVNEDLSITDLRTMDDVLSGYAEQRRIPATALALVGLLGLLLSAVGLYGVIAYGVRERARELGIRLALGARPVDIRRLVLRQGFGIVGIGLIAGTVGTAIFLQVLRSRLFGAGAMDPLILLSVCAVLSAVGGVALYLPARWASGLEPAQTLRSE